MKMKNKQTTLLSQHLGHLNKKVLKFTEIKSFLNTNRNILDIPNGTPPRNTIQALLKEKHMVVVELNLGVRKEQRFILGRPDPYEVALLVRPASYFTHQTALYLNGLTAKPPKIIYVNSEQPLKYRSDNQLEQESIDNAFGVEQRQSQSRIKYNNREIRLLSGMNTNQLGVIEKQNTGETTIRYTDLERTLIDITVRPAYSGGVADVFRAYKKASSNLSLPKLLEYLGQLDYKYPYHQAIGFYLDRTGNFPVAQLEPLKQLGLNYDFYLTHAMKQRRFNPQWRIHYPEELTD